MACLLGSTVAIKAQELIWSDDFDGPAGQAPSAANWAYDIGTNWGNNQLEWTTDRTENISLDGSGNLRITAREENFQGCAYTSGRIVTRGLFEPTYGRFEARIKLPVGEGIWPAFWLLGANISEVSWPQCGEIDIMEYRGQQPFINFGSAHGPGYSGGAAWTQLYTLPAGGFNDDFHVFTVEWSANRIDWMVDGIVYNTLLAGQQNGEWVFDHPFYIILNVAVGGNFVGAPTECTRFPQTMLVDWVRVWQ